MTAYGHLITQYGLLHHLFGLLESLVSFTFNLPLFFVSMFQYRSWTIKHPTYNNPRLHRPLSSPLIDYKSMIRSPSINITLSLCMGFGKRLGDGGWVVDDKSGISCGFHILFSLQISNLIFDSSLQHFRPEFVHHSCWRTLGHGNFRFAEFLTLNPKFTYYIWYVYLLRTIMVFNFLNSNLCPLILNDWIMITLFFTCLFH